MLFLRIRSAGRLVPVPAIPGLLAIMLFHDDGASAGALGSILSIGIGVGFSASAVAAEMIRDR